MDLSVTSLELAALLEQSEIDYMVDRMTAIRDREGNPEGVEIGNFGGATVFYSRTMPWGLFNNVKGMHDERVLGDIIKFYADRERDPEFQMIPGKTSLAVFRALTEQGFTQSGFHTTLYGPAVNAHQQYDDTIEVRLLRLDEMDTYAMIHCLGTGLSIEGKHYVAANNSVLYERPGWQFFIGLVHGQPAAVAVMYMKDEVASLTFAATLPEYRKQGLQQALLRQRINTAAVHGCKLVVSQAAFGSTSHRNMERIGLRIAYTRATWTRKS